MPKSVLRWTTNLSVSSNVPSIEQKFDALAGRHLAQFVLALAPLLAPTCFGNGMAPVQFRQFLVQSHAGNYAVRLLASATGEAGR